MADKKDNGRTETVNGCELTKGIHPGFYSKNGIEHIREGYCLVKINKYTGKRATIIGPAAVLTKAEEFTHVRVDSRKKEYEPFVCDCADEDKITISYSAEFSVVDPEKWTLGIEHAGSVVAAEIKRLIEEYIKTDSYANIRRNAKGFVVDVASLPSNNPIKQRITALEAKTGARVSSYEITEVELSKRRADALATEEDKLDAARVQEKIDLQQAKLNLKKARDNATAAADMIKKTEAARSGATTDALEKMAKPSIDALTAFIKVYTDAGVPVDQAVVLGTQAFSEHQKAAQEALHR